MQVFRVISLLIILFVFYNYSIAANNNLNFLDSLNFFPLNVSNKYQIEHYWHWWGFGGINESGTYYEKISIINDTTINNEQFFRFYTPVQNKVFPETVFYRYDSLENKIFVKLEDEDTVRLGVDFNATENTQFLSYFRGEPIVFTSYGLSKEFIFGDSLTVFIMQGSDAGSTNHKMWFADGIGLYKYRTYYSPAMETYEDRFTVITAIIDSTILNPLVLSIDTLYPVIDRPINTFPYLMFLDYSVSYSSLIQNFILYIKQIRDGTLISDQDYDISLWNPVFFVFPEDLEVGDIIKFKAMMNDTSIYYNLDYYPDSGYVTVEVLPPISNLGNDNDQFDLIYNLEQNYPNPFNPSTQIKFTIPHRTDVLLEVYDALGNRISILMDEQRDAGNYFVEFKADNLSSGIYFYRLKTREFIKTRKMLLIR